MGHNLAIIGAGLLLAGTAYAGLDGTEVHIVSEASDTPFVPGGQIDDLGNVIIGPGLEWSNIYPIYDFQKPGSPVVGTYQYDLDIGNDYIEITATWTINSDDEDPYLNYFSLIPGDFYGFHLEWDEPIGVESAALAVTGGPVNMGDLNLFADINPPLEAWVDAQIVAPESPARITINPDAMDINMQGIAWGYYWHVPGAVYSESSRVDLVFACEGDVDGDGMVNVIDLLDLIAAWGPCAGCDEDVNGDGMVDVIDLLALIANWGACP